MNFITITLLFPQVIHAYLVSCCIHANVPYLPTALPIMSYLRDTPNTPTNYSSALKTAATLLHVTHTWLKNHISSNVSSLLSSCITASPLYLSGGRKKGGRFVGLKCDVRDRYSSKWPHLCPVDRAKYGNVLGKASSIPITSYN